MIDELIKTVQKPSRYLGNEINVPRKDWAGSKVRMVLAFPDLYEMGMSHLGILLLYDILNQTCFIETTEGERITIHNEDIIERKGKSKNRNNNNKGDRSEKRNNRPQQKTEESKKEEVKQDDGKAD